MEGACLCGEITFSVSGKAKSVVNCHCTLCRRMNGAAFSTYAVVSQSDFTIQQGQPKAIYVTKKTQKHFCAGCGTPLYNTNPEYKGLAIIHIGTLQNCQELKPRANIFCQSQLDWTKDINSISGFEEKLSG
ncbi:MAG: GFA family protein [Aestuariibacter sp.]